MKSSGHHRALTLALLALLVVTAFRLRKSSIADDRSARSSEHRTPVSLGPPRTLSINHATQSELEALPGVGPALARRIIEARARGGSFRSLADLDAIRGVGPAMLRRLSPLLRFDSHVEGPARPDTHAEHVRQTALEEAR
jgi:competence ComEA-like helix-hairpin-helix protein